MDNDNQPQDNRTTNIPVMDVQPPQPGAAPSMNEPVENNPMPSPEPNSTDNRPNLSIPELPAHTKKKTPMVVVLLIIIIVALGLAAGAVYMYLQSNKTTEDTTPTNNNAQTTNVSGTDVNETKDEVEKSVDSLDDSKDLNSDDLSDTTLGL